MKRILVTLLFSLLIVGFVCAEEGWADINVDDEVQSEEDVEVEESAEAEEVPSGEDYGGSYARDIGEAVTAYTREFYLALGLGLIGILIVVYIVYLIIRGPKVKWKKPKPIKQ